MSKSKKTPKDMTMTELVEEVAKTQAIQVRSVGETTIQEGETDLSLFKEWEIRRILHDDEWWFSVVDIVGALSQSNDPSRYWSELKKKLSSESGGDQLFGAIEQLKMPSKDGKHYLTDCANAETIFRVVQSIPSPNAEPIKRWLAKTAYERILEAQNPEIAVKRAIADYYVQGRDFDWIRNRLQTIVTRNELTQEWQDRGVQDGKEYAMLTNTISRGTFEISTQQHKQLKGLAKRHNLRDHMTGLELVLTMLGEEATKEIAINTDAQGFSQNREAAKAGGSAAGAARKEIERRTRKPVLSRDNFLKGTDPKKLPDK